MAEVVPPSSCGLKVRSRDVQAQAGGRDLNFKLKAKQATTRSFRIRVGVLPTNHKSAFDFHTVTVHSMIMSSVAVF